MSSWNSSKVISTDNLQEYGWQMVVRGALCATVGSACMSEWIAHSKKLTAINVRVCGCLLSNRN